MVVGTVKQILARHQTDFKTQIMNERRYVYEILVGPDTKDDSKSIVTTLKEFKQTDKLQEKMKGFISSYDENFKQKIR